MVHVIKTTLVTTFVQKHVHVWIPLIYADAYVLNVFWSVSPVFPVQTSTEGGGEG